MLTLPPYEGRRRIIHIHEDIYCTILFRVCEFSGFQIAKTSVNKRLFMSPLFFAAGASVSAFNVCGEDDGVILSDLSNQNT